MALRAKTIVLVAMYSLQLLSVAVGRRASPPGNHAIIGVDVMDNKAHHVQVQEGEVVQLLETAARPIILMSVIMLCVLAVLRRHVSGFVPAPSQASAASQTALSVSLLVTFVGFVNFTSIIIDSYQLSLAVGQTITFSGLIIGIYMLGSAIGVILGWALFRCWPNLWREKPKQMLIIGMLVQALGATIYTLDTFSIALGFHGIPWVLIMARITMGVGHGLNEQVMKITFLRLVNTDERPKQTQLKLLANMLGIGTGLIVATCTVLVPSHLAHFHIIGFVQIVISLMTVMALGGLYPCLAGEEDFLVSNPADVISPEVHAMRRAIVMCCLMMDVCRGFLVSGVEAASALILEKDFEWTRPKVCLAVGLTFLSCIPWKFAHKRIEGLMSVFGWMQFFALTTATFSLLLSEWVSDRVPLGTRSSVLLGADSVIFSSIYMGGGLSMGVMGQYVLPDGSFFDGNHVMLWNGLLASGIGRLSGPLLARTLLDMAGRDVYALQQAAVALIFLALLEFGLRPLTAKVSDATSIKGSVSQRIPGEKQAEESYSKARGANAEYSAGEPAIACEDPQAS